MIESSTARALGAAREFGTWSGARRRDALYAVADALASARSRVLEVVAEETGLTEARLDGELDRTTGQLRLLGDFVAAGRDRPTTLSPKAAAGGQDILAVRVPIGPVAVFAASNFPLAFGVPGGDTASALAAGCPVVVKAHPAQPGTADLLGGIVERALAEAGAPAGTFAVLHGGPELSLALVRAPQIRAVGFTGSLSGGRALMDAAAARPDPIPVYAEMGSLNPVFVLPSALADDSWPTTLAVSVTASAGQLCTKPGLVVVPATPAGDAFADRLARAVAAAPVGPMLTPAMAGAHADWRSRADATGEVVAGKNAENAVEPFAVRVDADALRGELLTEHFGPTVVVCQAPVAAFGELAERLEGSLTATVLADPEDEEVAGLLPVLVRRAGRVIFNGVPTGVAVCDAMQHGGPWPAASAASFTSVGTAAVGRFLRPVALQGLPERLVTAVIGS